MKNIPHYRNIFEILSENNINRGTIDTLTRIHNVLLSGLDIGTSIISGRIRLFIISLL